MTERSDKLARVLVVAVALGLGASLLRRILGRPAKSATGTEADMQGALVALRDEVQALREAITNLKPAAGSGQPGVPLPSSSYAVAVRPAPGDKDQPELASLLDEVRSLQQDIDILKVNPNIGTAVSEALQRLHDSVVYDKSSYAVAVRPTGNWLDDPALKALVEEIQSLSQDLTALHASPEIGAKVAEAIKQAREAGSLPKSSYAVLVQPQPDEYEKQLHVLEEEVGNLRRSLEILKANPDIGPAVNSILTGRQDPETLLRPSYAVLV